MKLSEELTNVIQLLAGSDGYCTDPLVYDLLNHDHFYEYSDCLNTWKSGLASKEKLTDLINQSDATEDVKGSYFHTLHTGEVDEDIHGKFIPQLRWNTVEDLKERYSILNMDVINQFIESVKDTIVKLNDYFGSRDFCTYYYPVSIYNNHIDGDCRRLSYAVSAPRWVSDSMTFLLDKSEEMFDDWPSLEFELDDFEFLVSKEEGLVVSLLTVDLNGRVHLFRTSRNTKLL